MTKGVVMMTKAGSADRLCAMPTHRTFIATYIMASQRNGTLYVGMTSNLTARVWKHKTGAFDGFTAANDCKLLKKWLRDWKLALIENANPEWRDLAADWYPVNDPDWTPPPEED
jgi:putative endonuclease